MKNIVIFNFQIQDLQENEIKSVIYSSRGGQWGYFIPPKVGFFKIKFGEYNLVNVNCACQGVVMVIGQEACMSSLYFSRRAWLQVNMNVCQNQGH